jgi:hypothetical protein
VYNARETNLENAELATDAVESGVQGAAEAKYLPSEDLEYYS